MPTPASTDDALLYTTLVLFITMYGPRLSIGLPYRLRAILLSSTFRGIIIFTILYMANASFIYSLILAILFILTINMLKIQYFFERYKTIDSVTGAHTTVAHSS